MKVLIEQEDFGHTINILFYGGDPEHMQPGEWFSVAEPVELKFKRTEQWGGIKPTLKIPAGREFLQSLRDALDALGVPGNRSAKVEGLLEAQKAHLEDMRKLVLKNKA